MKSLVFASGNLGKFAEVSPWFAEHGYELISQNKLSVPDVEETGLSYLENALIKARHASQYTDLPVVADDSGISVRALGGRPGIYSARYGGAGSSWSDKINRLLEEMQDVPEGERQATFVCVVVLLQGAKDPMPIVAQGLWEGHVLLSTDGVEGFGYDPIFHANDQGCSVASLPKAVKSRVSHRGMALKDLFQKLEGKA